MASQIKNLSTEEQELYKWNALSKTIKFQIF